MDVYYAREPEKRSWLETVPEAAARASPSERASPVPRKDHSMKPENLRQLEKTLLANIVDINRMPPSDIRDGLLESVASTVTWLRLAQEEVRHG
jgi:hypothetical protein